MSVQHTTHYIFHSSFSMPSIMPRMTSSRIVAFQWRTSRGWWWSLGVTCYLACTTRRGTTWWVADLLEFRRIFLMKNRITSFLCKCYFANGWIFICFSPQPNTFQLVIAYDPSRFQTFVMYHYMDLGWDSERTLRRSMIGYFSYKYEQEDSLQLAPSMKQTAFRMQNRKGNTGRCNKLSIYQLYQHLRWLYAHY